MSSTLVLVRHGETEWSRDRKHTGTTDIALLPAGVEQAEALVPWLQRWTFDQVLCSPRQRAQQTLSLALPGVTPEIIDDLAEWNYGDYEGVTTADIHKERPGWDMWTDGYPNGDSPEQAAARAEAVVHRALAVDGVTVAFAHGHILRSIGAAWLGLGPDGGKLLALDTATVSVLDFERQTRVLRQWNLRPTAKS